MSTKTKKSKYPNVSDDTKNAILAAVRRASQPVTSGEVMVALAGERRPHSPYTINGTLRGLVADGFLVARPENDAERSMRADGSMPKGRSAILYWPAGADGLVPARTVRNVLEGVQTVAGVSQFKRTRPAGPAVQTGNRIDRLEREVAELRKLVASLVKAIG